MRFVVPPDWPQPPPGWEPPAGWQPDPSWPPAPAGWQFWVDPANAADESVVPSPPSGRRTRRTAVAAILVGVLLLATAVGASVWRLERVPSSPAGARTAGTTRRPTTTVTGWVRLTDRSTAQHDCEGQGDYYDIAEGTAVVISATSGVALGAGELTVYGVEGSTCTYTFSIADVPSDEPAYALTIDSREDLVVTREQLRSNAWKFDVEV